jgi:hypothetical protein
LDWKLYCIVSSAHKDGTNDGTPESHARNDGNTDRFSSLPDGYPPSQAEMSAGHEEIMAEMNA